jgi:hypothetical protein
MITPWAEIDKTPDLIKNTFFKYYIPLDSLPWEVPEIDMPTGLERNSLFSILSDLTAIQNYKLWIAFNKGTKFS